MLSNVMENPNERDTSLGAMPLRVRPDDIQTTGVNPDEVVRARADNFRRTLKSVISEAALYMSGASVTNASRARCAQVIEVCVNMLDSVVP